jgi:hypothetical protein
MLRLPVADIYLNRPSSQRAPAATAAATIRQRPITA